MNRLITKPYRHNVTLYSPYNAHTSKAAKNKGGDADKSGGYLRHIQTLALFMLSNQVRATGATQMHEAPHQQNSHLVTLMTDQCKAEGTWWDHSNPESTIKADWFPNNGANCGSFVLTSQGDSAHLAMHFDDALCATIQELLVHVSYEPACRSIDSIKQTTLALPPRMMPGVINTRGVSARMSNAALAPCLTKMAAAAEFCGQSYAQSRHKWRNEVFYWSAVALGSLAIAVGQLWLERRPHRNRAPLARLAPVADQPRRPAAQYVSLVNELKNRFNTVSQIPTPENSAIAKKIQQLETLRALTFPRSVEDLLPQHLQDLFICPLTHEIMRDPVIIITENPATAYRYERYGAQQWITENQTHPTFVSLQVPANQTLYTDYALTAAIESWLDSEIAKAQATQQDSAGAQNKVLSKKPSQLTA